MVRNMKDANATLFGRLARFAEERANPIPNPQAPRWVHANSAADEVLKNAKLHRSMSFGRFRHLAWLEFDGKHYVASVGFDHEILDPSLAPLDDIQGFDVCLLSELVVSPSASAVEVYNVVAAGNRANDPAYMGHDNSSIMALFPALRVFESADPVSEGIVWSIFLSFSAEESRHGGSWIEHKLADSLLGLAQENVESLPYNELCRSTLDLDPRSLFMSLYRCIEATYAHDKASKLKIALSVNLSWHEIAATLENEMSWRPLEATSLNVVLSHAPEADLREVCDCLGVNLMQDTDLRSATGKAIYQLRNRIVHYRPAHTPIDFDAINWNRLCVALVSIASDVFHTAYGQDPLPLSEPAI
jgi:hypothetical protein